jgi:MraZ protein
MLVAYHEQIEIWAKDRYARLLENEPEEFSDLAAEVFGGSSRESD